MGRLALHVGGMAGNVQDINNWKVTENCKNKMFQSHQSRANEFPVCSQTRPKAFTNLRGSV